MKGRFRDFWESLDPSKKKDNFSSDWTYSLVENRFITFLERFVQFVSRRTHTKLFYAPVNVNPVRGGGGGSAARAGDLTNFKIF